MNSVSAGRYANGVSNVGYSNEANSGYDVNNVDDAEDAKYNGGESSAVHPSNVYAMRGAKPVYRRDGENEDEDIPVIATGTDDNETEDVDATDEGGEETDDVDATSGGDEGSDGGEGESSAYGGDSETEDVDPSSTGDDNGDTSPTNLTCSEGTYKCIPGKPGFYYQCNFSKFVMRSCGPGTVCVENGDGTIHCGFP
ncbi:hypothetical protein AYI69_g1078 [Smittium culicis]|uniref:Carbohydrate-binding module family 19 domain-containing protein n=1 Tax=Smittium culicis TaxID=133412 RepID=A0A1R1YR87_9FUNG|nr:hypothetical protein AYI69_g1078 [Smittium culicis]